MSLFKAQITIVYNDGGEVEDNITVECEFEEVEYKVFEEFYLQEGVEGVECVIVNSFIDEDGNETAV